MKRMLSTAFVVTLGLALLASCSSSEPPKNRTHGVYMLIDTSLA